MITVYCCMPTKAWRVDKSIGKRNKQLCTYWNHDVSIFRKPFKTTGATDETVILLFTYEYEILKKNEGNHGVTAINHFAGKQIMQSFRVLLAKQSVQRQT